MKKFMQFTVVKFIIWALVRKQETGSKVMCGAYRNCYVGKKHCESIQKQVE